jgi:hypothetical protein
MCLQLNKLCFLYDSLRIWMMDDQIQVHTLHLRRNTQHFHHCFGRYSYFSVAGTESSLGWLRMTSCSLGGLLTEKQGFRKYWLRLRRLKNGEPQNYLNSGTLRYAMDCFQCFCKDHYRSLHSSVSTFTSYC